MIWRLLRRATRASNPHAAWWLAAEAAAETPSSEAIDELRRTMASGGDALDEAEQQEEMLEGLGDLLRLASAAELPVLVTQHRAVGADVCHAVMPVSIAGPAGASAKLFVTSRRLAVTGPEFLAWPWHRIRHLERHGRRILVVSAGEGATELVCNCYSDALAAAHLAARLSPRRPADVSDAQANG